MTRTTARPVAALGLVAALLTYVGCDGPNQSAGNSSASTKTASSSAGSSDGTKLFAGWTPEPAGVLLISGQQEGYLEPCGCTQGQLGGLLRRYDFIERTTRDRKWPMALIDLGSLIKDPASSRAGFEQTKIKFSFALQALTLLKYDAVALSADDLKLGVFEALGQFTNMADPTRVVVANIKAADFPKVVPSVRTKAGRVTLGITAVLDPEATKSLDQDKDAFLQVKPIVETLPAVLADLEKDTSVQVLMVQGPAELAKDLAEDYPGFDIIVATSEADPSDEPELVNDGKTMIVTVGKKGKYVGVVGFFPDSPQRLRYQRVMLGTTYNGPAKPMKELIEDQFREMLKNQKVVENFVRHGFADGIPGATFVGADACKKCHPKTYAKWESTGHASAFQALLNDPKPNTQFDAECVTCHTTGFEYNSGWKSAALTPHLEGNQCENCHGPSSKHVEQPDNLEFRKKIAMTVEGVEKSHFCIRCHDEDNSPKFDFAKDYRKIAHPGLDNKGPPAKPAQ